jgi:hypothetical protein
MLAHKHLLSVIIETCGLKIIKALRVNIITHIACNYDYFLEIKIYFSQQQTANIKSNHLVIDASSWKSRGGGGGPLGFGQILFWGVPY